MAGDLPGDCLGILEVRLGSGPAPVDLSIRLLEASQVRFFLARWPEGVRSIWLEFDLDREPDPVPCAKLNADVSPSRIAESLLPLLRGRPLAREQRDRFLACHREIPPSGRLLYVFSLLPRGIDAVRMEVYGLSPGEILGFLGRIAPGSVSRVSEITPLFEGVERLHLSFDVAPEGVLPRIGLEGSFPRLPRREPRWAELLGRWTGQGLCTPEKKDALLAWPGAETFWTAPAAWPIEAVGAQGFCVRGLSHVKVVSAPDREPEAKAYLSFGYAPRNPPERGTPPVRPPDVRSSRRTVEPADP
ncbi:MAG TPA: hypothetical protein VF414_02865 [Thermoanaerobaculia bacterium]